MLINSVLLLPINRLITDRAKKGFTVDVKCSTRILFDPSIHFFQLHITEWSPTWPITGRHTWPNFCVRILKQGVHSHTHTHNTVCALRSANHIRGHRGSDSENLSLTLSLNSLQPLLRLPFRSASLIFIAYNWSRYIGYWIRWGLSEIMPTNERI